MSRQRCANLCNESVLTWGSNLCRREGDFISMTGGAINEAGYVIPDDSVVREASISWKQDGCGEYNEKLQLLADGQVIGEAEVKSSDGVDRVAFSDLDIQLIAGQGLTVKSVAIDDDTCWEQACEIVVTVWVEKVCDVQPEDEGDGIFEVYLSDVGVVPIPDVWSIVNMDVIRVNTIPTAIAWDGTRATLQPGVYKVDYNLAIETKTSTSLNFRGKLVVDGVDYPTSGTGAYILAGAGGAESLSQSVVIVVEEETTVEVQAKVDTDTSTNATADANLIIQRIADGSRIPPCGLID